MLGGRLLEYKRKSKEWSRSLKKFEQYTITREFLKQYSTETQNGYLHSGRLREVVTMRELTVFLYRTISARFVQ